MICTREDSFTREFWLHQARWIATLASGLEVIQDDNRPGLAEPSAWLRLREYVQEHRDGIVALRFAFRNERAIHLPERQKGYFFRHGLGANLVSSVSVGFFLAGYLLDGQVQVLKYRVPEMLLCERQTRDPANEQLVGKSLIVYPGEVA